jgi:hypothetical protein
MMANRPMTRRTTMTPMTQSMMILPTMTSPHGGGTTSGSSSSSSTSSPLLTVVENVERIMSEEGLGYAGEVTEVSEKIIMRRRPDLSRTHSGRSSAFCLLFFSWYPSF